MAEHMLVVFSLIIWFGWSEAGLLMIVNIVERHGKSVERQRCLKIATYAHNRRCCCFDHCNIVRAAPCMVRAKTPSCKRDSFARRASLNDSGSLGE